MITTSDSVNIHKVLRHGVVTDYTPDRISLFMSYNGAQKRFTADEVVNSSETSSGLVKFNNVPLWGDGSYSLYITAENEADFDISGVNLNKIATGFIKKITNVNTLEL